MYRTLAFAAALARSATGFAPAVAAPRRTALMAKYTDASGNPIKAALSAYMHFCNDERATVTAEQKRLAGDSFKQTLVMTCVEIKQCVGRTKSFLGDDAAVLARSSGEEPTSPRQAGVAS